MCELSFGKKVLLLVLTLNLNTSVSSQAKGFKFITYLLKKRIGLETCKCFLAFTCPVWPWYTPRLLHNMYLLLRRKQPIELNQYSYEFNWLYNLKHLSCQKSPHLHFIYWSITWMVIKYWAESWWMALTWKITELGINSPTLNRIMTSLNKIRLVKPLLFDICYSRPNNIPFEVTLKRPFKY